MKFFKKIISVLLLLCMALPFASCGASLPGEDDRTVAMINDKYNVSYDLYKYFYLNYAASYGEEDFEGENAAKTEAELRESCFAALRNVYAVVVLSSEYGINLTDTLVEDTARISVEETIKEFGGKAAYAKALAENYMTDSVFRFMMKVDACEDQLYSTITDGLGEIDNSDETVMAAIKGDEFIRIVHVLISNSNGFSDEKNKETAEKVLKLARSGEDFDSLIANYSNDYSMTRDGYYFTYGYMLPEIEEASFKLKEGEISGIIESENGYHIIKRLPKDDEYMVKNYTTLKAQYESCKFYSLIDKQAESVSVKGNDLLETINHDLLVSDK